MPQICPKTSEMRRAMLISHGNPLVFVTRPINLAFVIATALIMIMIAMPALKRRRGDITG